jgi:hypothetical protein
LKEDAELKPFVQLIEALEPWLEQVVLIGGWAHRLYRLDPRAQTPTYPPLTTLDSDIAVPLKIEAKKNSIRDRLVVAGFREDFGGEDRPPATHYHLVGQGGFYAEFVSPLVGSEYGRKGERKVTREVGGISSQQLRYIEILLLAPWHISLNKTNGYPFKSTTHVRVANPVSFLCQKILIQDARAQRSGEGRYSRSIRATAVPPQNSSNGTSGPFRRTRSQEASQRNEHNSFRLRRYPCTIRRS